MAKGRREWEHIACLHQQDAEQVRGEERVPPETAQLRRTSPDCNDRFGAQKSPDLDLLRRIVLSMIRATVREHEPK